MMIGLKKFVLQYTHTSLRGQIMQKKVERNAIFEKLVFGIIEYLYS